MKKNNLSSCASALVLTAGLFAATFPAAGQSILINIYEGNPSAVQFVATSANPNNASALNLYGVDLIKYFTTAPAVAAGAVTGNLIPAGTTVAYTEWIPDNLLAAGQNVDLNLYNTSDPQTQVFSTSGQAFSGTATIDLSSLLANLPATGASGQIWSGNIHSPGQAWLIGKWTVVPEPPVGMQLALGAMVLAGLAFVRRSRRMSASR
jgi:MYXO-CTERM domain-containing protein